MTELPRPPRWWWLPLIPLGLLLALHARWYWFVNDDAYISFVYARNFAEHNQLVFNLGEHVEGYTNFLWTLGLGLLMKLGAAPEVAAPWLGLGFGIGTLAVVARLSARLRGASTLWDWLPAALLVSSAGFACWCTGGLESMLFTFLCTLGLERVFAGSFRTAAIAFALAAMTRPEGLLVVALVGLHHYGWNLIKERRGLLQRRELVFVLTFLVIFVPYFVWRYRYYGDLFPNTAYVKAGGTPPAGYADKMHAQGLFYVWQWAWQSKALLAAPLAAVALWRFPRFASLAWLIIVVYLVYTWRVGGDFMGLHRFVLPLFPLVALLFTLGLGWLAARIPWRPSVPALAVLATGLYLLVQIPLGKESHAAKADHGIDRPGYLKLYADDRILIGKALAPLIKPDELSWVGGVGVQPYYGRMRAYDVFGLVSRKVAHEVPPSNPRPGHQKWAPPEMVLETSPTFIFYCYALHADPQRFSYNCPEVGLFKARGFEDCTLHIPGMKERGEYYTFLKRKEREFPCLQSAH